MNSRSTFHRAGPLAALSVAALTLSACSAGGLTEGGGGENGATTISFLTDTSEASVALSNGLADAFNASQDEIVVEVETRPEGAEGDNLVKTRLSTGEMNDVFLYNTGSLFQALDPEQNLVPVPEGSVDDVQDTFLETVRAGEELYGVPVGYATGGGVLYNMKVYEDLGLEIPQTWDEFMANNEEVKKAGLDPVIQTYADTWTSQLFVLGDYHNVAAEDPDWADSYTANEVKYSDEPAVEGFEHLQEVHDAGYINKDFASATLEQGLEKLAKGEGAHYPMLTFALGGLYAAFPDASEDIGIFGLPGDDAESAGLTVWTGGGIYVPKSTEGAALDAAQQFREFIASAEGCQAQIEAYAPSGPAFVEGCDLPSDIPPAVQDMVDYFDSEGATTPALEFLSPVKGPALEQITVEVGSGIRSAEDGAALYDEDVEKQAQQLGLPGWE
jgi:raffinose/stachyose/melibiose transport system substrate-binding protein